MVRARSVALTPVVMPVRASALSVKAVLLGSVLCSVIMGMPRRSSSWAVMGAQMMPVECRIAKASCSVVAVAAGKMRSPSFSRLSSSTTMTIRPSRRAVRASSMLSMRVPGRTPLVLSMPADPPRPGGRPEDARRTWP